MEQRKYAPPDGAPRAQEGGEKNYRGPEMGDMSRVPSEKGTPQLYSIFCKCGRFDRLVNLYFWDASYSNQLGKISITFAKSLSKFARRRALRKNWESSIKSANLRKGPMKLG